MQELGNYMDTILRMRDIRRQLRAFLQSRLIVGCRDLGVLTLLTQRTPTHCTRVCRHLSCPLVPSRQQTHWLGQCRHNAKTPPSMMTMKVKNLKGAPLCSWNTTRSLACSWMDWSAHLSPFLALSINWFPLRCHGISEKGKRYHVIAQFIAPLGFMRKNMPKFKIQL